MEFNTKEMNDITVVELVGTIDAGTAGEITEKMSALIDDGAVRLVVNLSGVDYTSSAGLRMLLATAKQTRSAGGDLRLAEVLPAVLKVLTMSGFTSILKVFDDTVTAVESYA